MASILVDTSCWVEALRFNGNKAISSALSELIADDQLAWCDMVVLELWNGVGGAYERKSLKELERLLPCIKIDSKIWKVAKNLALSSRLKGITVPAADLLIAACSIEAGFELWHCDKHFSKLPGLKNRYLLRN